MTKEEYLNYRQTNQWGDLLYFYYKEHNGDLDVQQFINFINMWFNMVDGQSIIQKVLKYYDGNFGVTSISDVEGKIIKYI